MNKKLQRPPDTAMIGGVCAGIAEYFGVDPTWIRLLAVLLIFASGFGLVAYLVGWVVIPRGPLTRQAEEVAAPPAARAAEKATQPARGLGFIPGVILVIIGMAFLFDNLFFWFDWDYVWPLLLVGGGLLMIYQAIKPSHAPENEIARDIAEVHDAGR